MVRVADIKGLAANKTLLIVALAGLLLFSAVFVYTASAIRSERISPKDAIVAAWKSMVYADRITCEYDAEKNLYYVKVYWIYEIKPPAKEEMEAWKSMMEEYWKNYMKEWWEEWENITKQQEKYWEKHPEEYWREWQEYWKVPMVFVTHTGTLTFVINATTGEVVKIEWSWEVKKEITKEEALKIAYAKFPHLKQVSVTIETWHGKQVWKVEGMVTEHHYWFIFHWTMDCKVELLIDYETGDILRIVKGGEVVFEKTWS